MHVQFHVSRECRVQGRVQGHVQAVLGLGSNQSKCAK